MADFDRELRRLRDEAGCRLVRAGKGSPLTNQNVAVPNGIKSRHTANGVLKQAGLPKRFF